METILDGWVVGGVESRKKDRRFKISEHDPATPRSTTEDLNRKQSSLRVRDTDHPLRGA
jgi:hypothetical protein